jgi:ABC-type lipoprotein export system ATPase subunit/GNAT superfamily N-acetyltransferase
MKATITVSSPVPRSARVLQMASLFDVPVEAKTSRTWQHDLPVEAHPWQVGLIVGPSGSGKTTLARHLFGAAVVSEMSWAPDGALLDDFPASMGIRDVVGALTAVGLSSPPAWMRPYATLSNGEAFRAGIARALAEHDDLVVVDEFTSVVDRQVAKVASHTVQKTVRRTPGRQFVAVTCHYDVTDWLQPDWVYDVAGGTFSWRQVQPHPQLNLAIHPVSRAVWPVFAHHHYLSSKLATGAHCYGGFIGDECVAFASYIHFPHAHTRNIKMAHRVVVLPDYQGLSIGGRISDWLGQHLYNQGYRFRYVTVHPGLIRYFARSPRWRDASEGRKRLTNTSTNAALRARALNPRFLSTKSYEYTPPAQARS